MRHVRRIAAAAAALIAGHASRAAAQPGAPTDGDARTGCADVRVIVQGASQATTSAKIMEAIFAEVSPRASARCPPGQARSAATIVVEWTGPQTARLRVELGGQAAPVAAAREIDLTGVARDTVPLTLAIATDELLREARDRARAEESEAASAPPAPSVAAPAEPSSLRVAPRRGRWSFGSAIGAEWFSSGVALAGPDATLDVAMHPALTLSLHAGLRAIVADGGVAERGVMTEGGAWLRFRLSGDGRGGTGLATGADVLLLANAAGSAQATVVPAAALSGWHTIVNGGRLAVDAGGGVPLLRLTVPTGSAIAGAELRLRVSLMVDF